MQLRRLSLYSLFMAIILMQTTIPGLGYLPIGPLSLTILPVTIMIAAILLGPFAGALLGSFWGMIVFVRAFFAPTSPLALVFTNPLIAILPRLLIGLIIGWLFRTFVSKKVTSIKLALLGGLGSLINTVLVLGMIALFFGDNAHAIYQISKQALIPYLITTIFTNGIPEIILDAILLPLIVRPLLKFMKQ